MESGYETVVDPQTMVWTLSAIGIHGAVAFLQAALAAYLVASGIRRIGDRTHRGAMRIGLAALLVVPITLDASWLVSTVACVAAIALLATAPRGGPLRNAAVVAAALCAAFAAWEREDGLTVSVAVLANSLEWRMHEMEWQTTTDRDAPKTGELAPDFELQDPSGAVAVRLSDFRGKRPVALVFGSYT